MAASRASSSGVTPAFTSSARPETRSLVASLANTPATSPSCQREHVRGLLNSNGDRNLTDMLSTICVLPIVAFPTPAWSLKPPRRSINYLKAARFDKLRSPWYFHLIHAGMVLRKASNACLSPSFYVIAALWAHDTPYPLGIVTYKVRGDLLPVEVANLDTRQENQGFLLANSLNRVKDFHCALVVDLFCTFITTLAT